MIGKASFGFAVGMDIKGVINYYDNPASPNTVHPAKAGINTAVGAIGTWGGLPGAMYGIFFFGVDSFYPGGWNGIMNNIESAEQETGYSTDWGTMTPNGA